MVQEKRVRRWRGRQRAAVAALLALAVLLAGAWIAGGANPAASRPPAGAGSAGAGSTGPGPTGAASTGVGGTVSGASAEVGTGSPGRQPAVVAQPAGLRLSAGRVQQPAPPVPAVKGQPLGGQQVAGILGRLPAWAGGSALEQPFRWPVQSIRTPPAGSTVPLAFPGTSGTAGAGSRPDPTPTGALHVLRMQPQGPVAVAPFISVTFDQPMVAVATVGQLAATAVPVTISPKVPGSWQWIGTSTLRFAVDRAGAAGAGDATDLDRLPMATDFTVTVPAGTRAAGGAKLAATASFRFSTPPPTVRSFQPSGSSMALDPVFVAVFDQRIDPAAVLRAVRVSAGDAPWPVRPATAAEVAADPAAAGVVNAAPAGRVMAFRPARAFPASAAISTVFAVGTPSLEGRRTTTTASTYSGRTYSALALTSADCGYQGDKCPPGAPLVLTFNNVLDAKTFDPKTVRISPAIPGVQVIEAERTIVVQGDTQPDTTYTVTAPAGLTDTFGQHLAAPAAGKVHLLPASPRMDSWAPLTTLDPMVAAPSITVQTLNRKEFRERVFTVRPADWTSYQRAYVRWAQQDPSARSEPELPDWPSVVDRVVTVGGQDNRLISTKLDLSKVMAGPEQTGSVVVVLEPTSRDAISPDDSYQNRAMMTWAQSTVLGLDAVNDATTLRTWVTDLRDGSPQSGVTVSLVPGDGRVDDQARSATTGADGIAAVPLTTIGAGALLAQRGSQSALLPSMMWNNSWVRMPTTDRLLWFVDDDRQTYRPGETVSVKG